MIIFRQINEPKPDYWVRGMQWYVEYHDHRHDVRFPLGVGYVVVADEDYVTLEFILVADQHRRKGVATSIVRACEERWPGIVLSSPISQCGEKLMSALDKRR